MAERSSLLSVDLEDAACEVAPQHDRSSLKRLLPATAMGALLLLACAPLLRASGGPPRATGGAAAFETALAGVTRFEEDEAQALLDKYKDLLEDLNVTVLQCEEGIEELQRTDATSVKTQGSYIVNVMLTAMGLEADACSLTGNVNKEPPVRKQKACFVHCGEPKCEASLKYIDTQQQALSQYCESLIYLQGGAKCFVEQGMELNNATACADIVGATVPCDAC